MSDKPQYPFMTDYWWQPIAINARLNFSSAQFNALGDQVTGLTKVVLSQDKTIGELRIYATELELRIAALEKQLTDHE